MFFKKKPQQKKIDLTNNVISKEEHNKKIRIEAEAILIKYGEKNVESMNLLELIMSFSKLANVDFDFKTNVIKDVTLHKVEPTTKINGVFFALFILNDRNIVDATFTQEELNEMLRNGILSFNSLVQKKREFNTTDIVLEILDSMDKYSDGFIDMDYLMDNIGRVYYSKYINSSEKPSFTKILSLVSLSCGYTSMTEMVAHLSYDQNNDSYKLKKK